MYLNVFECTYHQPDPVTVQRNSQKKKEQLSLYRTLSRTCAAESFTVSSDKHIITKKKNTTNSLSVFSDKDNITINKKKTPTP